MEDGSRIMRQPTHTAVRVHLCVTADETHVHQTQLSTADNIEDKQRECPPQHLNNKEMNDDYSKTILTGTFELD